VLVSYRARYRTPLEITGQEGVLRAEDAFTVERPVRLELVRDHAQIDSETVSNADAYARQVDAFAEALEGGAPFPVPGEDGWQNQEVLDAAFRSLASGKAEDVPLVPCPTNA
jgi:predicted dehydrogenase